MNFNTAWTYSWKGLAAVLILGLLLGTQIAAVGWCKYFITCKNECKCPAFFGITGNETLAELHPVQPGSYVP